MCLAASCLTLTYRRGSGSLELFPYPLENTEVLSGYGLSKLVADTLCCASHARGVPSSVFRLGLVGPSTSDGTCSHTDWFTQIIRSGLLLGGGVGCCC